MWAEFGNRLLIVSENIIDQEKKWINVFFSWRVVSLKLCCAALFLNIFILQHKAPPPLTFLESLKMYLHNTQALFKCNSLLHLVFGAKYEFLIKETVQKRSCCINTSVLCGSYFRKKHTYYIHTKKSAGVIVTITNLAKEWVYMCIK